MGFLDNLIVGGRRALLGLFALNAAACWLFLSKGTRAALAYVDHTYKLYSGYGLPWLWEALPWRSDLRIPCIPVDKLFPQIDFTRSLEILFPLPRTLGVMPHELVILAHLVRHLQPRRVVELGTAEGRTTINLAFHSPPDAEVLTVNFPPDPPKNYVGYFYWNHPLRSKIKELFTDLTAFDWSPYKDSGDFVFCDACDNYHGLAVETTVAFQVVRPGGIVLWHDYGTGRDRTQYLNDLSRALPIRHIEGTALVCLQIDNAELLEKVRRLSVGAPQGSATRMPTV